MILPFRGHGYLVIVFYVGSLILTQLVVDAIMGEGVYTAHAWPKYVAVAVGAALCWIVGSWLNSAQAPKRLLDLDTGEEFVQAPPSHEFLYLKVEHWGLIGAIACVAITFLSEFDLVRF